MIVSYTYLKLITGTSDADPDRIDLTLLNLDRECGSGSRRKEMTKIYK
jgi:hypothetical protein